MEWVEDVQLFVRKGAANPAAYRMAAPLLADILQSLKVGCSFMVQHMISADLKRLDVILANQTCLVRCLSLCQHQQSVNRPLQCFAIFRATDDERNVIRTSP